MKVKAIQRFRDKKENVERKVDDVFECTKERATELLEFKLGERPYPLIEIIDKAEADKVKETKEEQEGTQEKEQTTVQSKPEAKETAEDKTTEAEPKKRTTKTKKKEE